MLELKNLTVKRGDLTVADHINVRLKKVKCIRYLGQTAQENPPC